MTNEAILSAFLCFSLAANAFFLWRHLKYKPSEKTQTYDVKRLIHDLSESDALVSFRRVAPEDIFVRSPRD